MPRLCDKCGRHPAAVTLNITLCVECAGLLRCRVHGVASCTICHPTFPFPPDPRTQSSAPPSE